MRLFDEHAQHGPVIIVEFRRVRDQRRTVLGRPHRSDRASRRCSQVRDRVVRSRMSAPPGSLVVELERLVDSRIPA